MVLYKNSTYFAGILCSMLLGTPKLYQHNLKVPTCVFPSLHQPQYMCGSMESVRPHSDLNYSAKSMGCNVVFVACVSCVHIHNWYFHGGYWWLIPLCICNHCWDSMQLVQELCMGYGTCTVRWIIIPELHSYYSLRDFITLLCKPVGCTKNTDMHHSRDFKILYPNRDICAIVLIYYRYKIFQREIT